MNVIEFNHVWKSFHRAAGQQLVRHYLADLFGGADSNPFHALKDISFEIGKSECVGVVGANGAGSESPGRCLRGGSSARVSPVF